MNQKSAPAHSQSLSLFREWVFQRSDPFDAATIARDPNWGLDRAALAELCRAMPETDLAQAFLYAVFLGDVTLAQTLWGVRGPFKVHLADSASNALELNGEAYDTPNDRMYLFEAIRHLDQLKSMLDLINNQEITGLLDGPGALFLRGGLKVVSELARSVEFEGELPALNGEFVSHPELAIALNEAARGRPHTKAYDPVLCWATPEMIKAYGEYLDPYWPVHGVKLGASFIDFPRWRALHEQAELEADEPPACEALTLRCHATGDDFLGQIVMQVFGSKKQQHGVFEKPGYVLCHTTCSFLAEFERPAALDTQNYAAARSFTECYVPLDLMALKAHPGGIFNHPTEMGFQHSGKGKEIAFMSLGADIHDALGPVLSHSQWKFILRNQCLLGSEITTAVKVIGLDNQGMIWKLEQETPGELKDLGYRFTSDTEVFLQDKKGVTLQDRLNSGATCVDLSKIKTHCRRTDINEYGIAWGRSMLQDTYEIGLWPFKEPKRPLSKLIPRLARTKEPTDDLTDMASIARVIIKDSPIEECVKHAKTAAEWTLLAYIHGPDAMQPYLREMPLTSRGKVFSQDLGL